MPLSESVLDAAPQTFRLQAPRRLRVAVSRRQKSYVARYIAFHSVCFFLYAAVGKGFAYVGYAPLFIGEVLLLCGLYVALKTGNPVRLASTPIGIALVVFFLWGLARTLPFLGRYGSDALRDAMVWVYSLFAWVVASIVLGAGDSLGVTIQRYRKYGGVMLVLMFMSFAATAFVPASLPTWPGTGVTIPLVKPGDMCVHVAGLLAFVLVGLGARKSWWVVPGLCAFLAGSALNRGGLLACLLAVGIAFLFYPNYRKAVPLGLGMIVGLALLVVSDFSFKSASGARSFSASQVGSNIESIFGLGKETDEGGLNQTKQWRLNWWKTIVGYTLQGPYFWTGKGFGINLTVSDGVARNENAFPGLRSPHNSHLTFLARSGCQESLSGSPCRRLGPFRFSWRTWQRSGAGA